MWMKESNHGELISSSLSPAFMGTIQEVLNNDVTRSSALWASTPSLALPGPKNTHFWLYTCSLKYFDGLLERVFLVFDVFNVFVFPDFGLKFVCITIRVICRASTYLRAIPRVCRKLYSRGYHRLYVCKTDTSYLVCCNRTRPRSREAAWPPALQIEKVHHRIGMRRNIMRHTPCLVRFELFAIPKPRPAFERHIFRNLRRFFAHLKHARPLLDLLAEVLRIKHGVCCAMKSLELWSKAPVGWICVAHESRPLRSRLDDPTGGARVVPDIEAVSGKATERYTSPCASCCEDVRIAADETRSRFAKSVYVAHAVRTGRFTHWSSLRPNSFR
jgi:hypothetical protein